MAPPQTPASIASDQADYAPGGLVTLTGTDWQPGESVHIYVNDDFGSSWSHTANVVVDANGRLVDQFNLPNWFVAEYSVVAAGEVSGVATTSFTDGIVRVKTVGAGPNTATIDWNLYSGSGCTGSILASGTIVAATSGNGTDVTSTSAGQSLSLSAHAISTYEFSSWSGGSFVDFSSNPGCLNHTNGAQNTQVNFVPDTTPPAAPSITSSSPSSPANDNSPELIGTAEAGSTVRIYTNATCTSAVAASGSAAAFAAPGLTVSVANNTTTNFHATATDAASNTSPCSSPASTYVEDSAAPMVTAFGCTPGTTPTSSTTFNCSVTFSESVTGFSSTTSDVTVGGTSLAWTKGASSGTGAGPFTFTVTRGAPNTDGTLTLQVAAGAATDAAGNSSIVSSTLSYTIDTTAPTVTVTTAVNINKTNKTNASASGSVEAGATVSVTVTDGTTTTGAAAATLTTMTWSVSGIDVTTLADGTITYTATATDAVGNTATATKTATKDTLAPAAPAVDIVPPYVNNANQAAVDITISGEAGTTVSGSVTDSASGSVSFSGTIPAGGTLTLSTDLSGLADGSLTASATLTDAAGNSSTAGSDTATKDTLAPAAPAVTSSSPSSPANDNSPELIGTAEAGSTVRIYTNVTCTSILAASGSAAGFASPGLTVTVGNDTTTNFYATATDAAGNVSPCSSPAFIYVEDRTAPYVLSINRAGGSPTNASSVSWTVTFSESVTGVDATDFDLAITGLTGSPAITSVTGGGTTWTVTASTGGGDGTLGLDLDDDDSIVDAAGNSLGDSSNARNGDFTGQVYTIDRTNPTGTITINSGATYTNSASVTLNLTATDTNQIVAYRVANGGDCSSASFVAVAPVDPYSASVAFTLTGADGTKTVCVQYKDAAGNLSTTYTDTIILDRTAPDNAITFPAEGGVYSEASWNAGCATPVGDMCGTAGDGGSGLNNVTISLKRLSDNFYYNFTTQTFASAFASKTFSPGTSWTEGLDFSKFSPATSYKLDAIATDNAGNMTARSATFTINVYDLQYLAPIDQSSAGVLPPVLNKGNWGRVIPVKINVFLNGAQQTGTQIPAGSLTIKVVKTVCSSGAPVDTIEQYADAGTSSGNTDQFRVSGDSWIYNLDTKALNMTVNDCYRLDVYLSGVKISTQHFAIFQPVK
jgi:hypothetical protein